MSSPRWGHDAGAHVAAQPDKAAFIQADMGETRTYAELETNSVRLARHLRGIGLAAGGDVTSITGNIPQVFEIYRAGLCSACTSPGSTTT